MDVQDEETVCKTPGMSTVRQLLDVPSVSPHEEEQKVNQIVARRMNKCMCESKPGLSPAYSQRVIYGVPDTKTLTCIVTC